MSHLMPCSGQPFLIYLKTYVSPAHSVCPFLAEAHPARYLPVPMALKLPLLFPEAVPFLMAAASGMRAWIILNCGQIFPYSTTARRTWAPSRWWIQEIITFPMLIQNYILTYSRPL